jgi:hypothetical protein
MMPYQDVYLVPKEGDTTYDQQHSVLLKPERILLRTLHTTTLMDSTFRVSLLSNALVLKFK